MMFIVHVNSIVNEVIKTISILFKKGKLNDFPALRRFCACKTVAFVVFCSLVFVFLVGFGLICVFLCLKFFCKKIWNCLDSPIVLIAHVPLSTHQSKIYFYTLISICDNLWESLHFLRIFSFLWSSVRIYFLKSLSK